MLKTKPDRLLRHDKLTAILAADPMITDNELASRLGVSISTVRLDRALMGVPELRERIRTMAQNAVSNLQSLSPSEVIGELLELEPRINGHCRFSRLPAIWPSGSRTL